MKFNKDLLIILGFAFIFVILTHLFYLGFDGYSRFLHVAVIIVTVCFVIMTVLMLLEARRAWKEQNKNK